jgi:hypothetical protein
MERSEGGKSLQEVGRGVDEGYFALTMREKWVRLPHGGNAGSLGKAPNAFVESSRPAVLQAVFAVRRNDGQ